MAIYRWFDDKSLFKVSKSILGLATDAAKRDFVG